MKREIGVPTPTVLSHSAGVQLSRDCPLELVKRTRKEPGGSFPQGESNLQGPPLSYDSTPLGAKKRRAKLTAGPRRFCNSSVEQSTDGGRGANRNRMEIHEEKRKKIERATKNIFRAKLQKWHLPAAD